jgi:crotonobetainyl-CoA:carnitine CoA-transferase CaiB-like acyl-CoA transferase
MIAAPGSLSHLKVLDLGRMFAGPYCTQMLADFGADVIKVENPVGGDDIRFMGAPLKDRQGNETDELSSYLAMNRGKKSITVDITKPEGRDIILRLADQSDVFIENFKAGAMKRYGLDYETLSKRNPRLVYCSITGFGQEGPHSALPGYDPLFQAMSGIMSVTGNAEGEENSKPVLIGYSISDINAALYAAIGILTALNHRDNVSGRGQFIDLALLDAQIASASHLMMNYLVSGKLPVRSGSASQINCPWQAFECADMPLMVAVGNNRQFESLAKAIGHPEMAADARFGSNRSRMQNKPALLAILEPALKKRAALDWMEVLNKVGVPTAPIYNLEDMFADPQVRHRGVLKQLPHDQAGTMPAIANPIHFSETPATYRWAPPRHGQHTAEVLADALGLSESEIAGLKQSAII